MKMKSYTYIPLRVSRHNRPNLVHHALVSVVQEVRCPEAHAAQPHVHCNLAEGHGSVMHVVRDVGHLVLDAETLRVVVPHLVGGAALAVVEVRSLGALVPAAASVSLA